MNGNYILQPDNLTHAVTAVGALGTAAFALVDSLKQLPRGGISTLGFAYIQKGIAPLLPADGASVIGQTGGLETLHSNWINGMATDDQKAIAKSIVKLNLSPDRAPQLAAFAGLPDELKGFLASAAAKMRSSATVGLSSEEADALGRFELALSTLMDQCYQRADQQYRNACKLAAVGIAVCLALLGGFSLQGNFHSVHDFFFNFLWSHEGVQAFIIGLLACPLAPIAKDVASAIQAGAQAVNSLRG